MELKLGKNKTRRWFFEISGKPCFCNILQCFCYILRVRGNLKSIKNRKNTEPEKILKNNYVQFSKKTKKCDFRVPLGTPKGGQRTNFFSTFSALGAQGGQKAPRCPPRGPRDRPKGSQGSVDELKRCPREPQKC